MLIRKKKNNRNEFIAVTPGDNKVRDQESF